ncbi:RRQRL motif-containing zinc-binding protein [Kutzneria buriramensis]|uniref:Uncharacterized protein n=1 Tax=Kutzneria buriramensis TaxID=1045776 RepID=A0A3E0GUG6_9PSEU|nr:RRQRL motif-containing zinc-binding protein [Kutzneria buriramensis]REH26012.1 hypothetical protein BCF44_13551 [Kutzneria buriramensis]
MPEPLTRAWRTELDCDDPAGERHPVPTYPWGKAPIHLITRRQIRDAGLSPGHPPVAQMLRCRKRHPDRPLRAWLYDVHLTVDKRVPSPAQLDSIDNANQAWRTCSTCRRDVGYRIPRTPPCSGECVDCATTAGRIPRPVAA